MNGTQKALARFGLASAALIAAISAPVTVACAAIGGAASYKLGKNYGQKKYGGRDIGGVMPIALIGLGSGLGGAAAYAPCPHTASASRTGFAKVTFKAFCTQFCS
jgi:hypothetical protein